MYTIILQFFSCFINISPHYNGETLSVYTANRVFAVLVSLERVKRYSKKKKNGFRHFNAPKTSFKVPASATPNAVDRESVQNKSLGF